MIQIPVLNLHIYIVQVDLKVTSLSNKGQPLASSHSEEVSPCKAILKEGLLFSEMHLDLA